MTIQMKALDENNRYIYDLGTAHSRAIYPDLVTFVAAISKAAGHKHNLCCFTNQQQTKERGFLDDIGFATVKLGERMAFHSISIEKWNDFYKNIKVKAEEIERKNREEYDNYIRDLRENEKEQGRAEGELRVGDIIGFLNSVNEEDTLNIALDRMPVSRYVVTTVLSSGVLFKAVINGKPHGSEFRNYDSYDYTYQKERCVRIKEHWNTKCL